MGKRGNAPTAPETGSSELDRVAPTFPASHFLQIGGQAVRDRNPTQVADLPGEELQEAIRRPLTGGGNHGRSVGEDGQGAS